MSDAQRSEIDRVPVSRPRSLRQACVKVGLDHGGRRCPDCPLRGLCQSELRWLVKTEREQMYRC